MAVGTQLPFPHPHVSQLLNGEAGDEQDLREAQDRTARRWDRPPPLIPGRWTRQTDGIRGQEAKAGGRSRELWLWPLRN